MNSLKIKRIYDPMDATDGYRILVDRIWPRGVSKENAHLDEWMKDIAPSTELRKWFNHEAEKADEFADLYKKELEQKSSELAHIQSLLESQNVTLLFAAKTAELSQAKVIVDYLKKNC